MKLNLTVKDYYRKLGSKNRMVYVDENGMLFDGPERDVTIGYTYTVETSGKSLDDKFYYIIKFIGMGKKL